MKKLMLMLVVIGMFLHTNTVSAISPIGDISTSDELQYNYIAVTQDWVFEDFDL